MLKSFTTEFIRNNSDCYSQEELLRVYERNKDKECFETPACTVTIQEILSSNIPLEEKFWFVSDSAATTEENEQLAIEVAIAVLPFYEKEYPEDKRLREAIQAFKDFRAKSITKEELKEKKMGAYSAYGECKIESVSGAAWAAYVLNSGVSWPVSCFYGTYCLDCTSELYSGTLLQTLKDFCSK